MAGPGSLQSYEIESECLRDWLAGDTLKYTVGWVRIDFKAIHSVVRKNFQIQGALMVRPLCCARCFASLVEFVAPWRVLVKQGDH